MIRERIIPAVALAVLLLGSPSVAYGREGASPGTWTSDELTKYWTLNGAYGDSASLTVPTGPMIASTSGAVAIHAGIKTLGMGGSAADAAIATALAQITLTGGSWNSFAGMLYALHYDSKTEQVNALNAGFNTVRDETDPSSIPRAPSPSGRTAMVGGFMAGVQELHDRYGRLPFEALFEPAIWLAEVGVPVDSFMQRIMASKKEVLARTAEGRAIFIKADGNTYQEGDTLRQPQLAATLQKIAHLGASYMYEGEWAARFVEAVRSEGGKVRLEDLKEYDTDWEPPLNTQYRGFQVNTIQYPELGAVQLLEAVNMLELADIVGTRHYTEVPKDLFRFIQICRVGYVITYSSTYRPDPDEGSLISWISPQSRVKKETARGLLDRLSQDNWELELHIELNPPIEAEPDGEEERGSDSLEKDGGESTVECGPGGHSDAIVVVDGRGDVAVVVHSINTSLWGSTGLFVDGVSIPDPASFQQGMVGKVRPGKRFPNIVNPVIVTENGRPVLAMGAIGNALHECTLQHLSNIMDYDMAPGASLKTPKFWGPMWGGAPEDYKSQAVDGGAFSPDVLAEVRRMGQPLEELEEADRKRRISYWAGIRFYPDGTLSGAVSHDFNGIVESSSP